MPEMFEVAQNRTEILTFWADKFWGKGIQNFGPDFINLGHHRTCGKV